MDRLRREGNPPVGQLASPVPQYKRPGATEYDPVEGQHGAPFATLKDASGAVVSPATEAKLEQVRALLAGVATEAKLEQARVLLNTISGKDFATDTELKAVKSKLADIETKLTNLQATLTDGSQKVQQSGTMMELYGATIDNRPLASSVTVGATYMAVDTQEVWQSNGTDWVVM